MMQLRIYAVALEMVKEVMAIARRVQEADRDLARQMRRACTSVPLNLCEGAYSRGGNRAARFQDAMASARETMASIEVSVAAGYVGAGCTPDVLDKLDHIVATLWKLLHR